MTEDFDRTRPTPTDAAPAASELFVVEARTRLNFYPGTMMQTPPDYRRVVQSVPMPRGGGEEPMSVRPRGNSFTYSYSVPGEGE